MEASAFPLTFWHWAGVSPYTSAFALAEACAFVKQSAGPFLCGLLRLSEFLAYTLARRSFSRSYGAILPNSLTRVLPIALVYSTRLPVSVCGTGTRVLLEAFLGSLGLAHLWPQGHRHHLSGFGGGFASRLHLPTGLAPALPVAGWPTLLRPPIASPHKWNDSTWYGNINPLSIAYGFRPRLRPD